MTVKPSEQSAQGPFSERDTEAHRKKAICLKSHRERVAEPRLPPELGRACRADREMANAG